MITNVTIFSEDSDETGMAYMDDYVENYVFATNIISKCCLHKSRNKQECMSISKNPDFATKHIFNSTWNNNVSDMSIKCPFVSIDASATYVSNAVDWEKDVMNQEIDSNEAIVLPVHRIKHVIPNAKNIIMVRDPIDKLESDFYYFVHGEEKLNPDYFHRLVVNGIEWWENCTGTLTEERCAYGYNYTGTGVADLGKGVFEWGDSPGIFIYTYNFYT